MTPYEQLLDPREMIPHWMGLPGMGEFRFTRDYFDAVNPKPDVDSDQVELISISAIQQPGPANKRDGAARVVEGQGGTKRLMKGFRYFVERPLAMDALKALHELDSPSMQKKGVQLLENAMAEERQRYQLFKDVILSYVRHTGRVNLRADGAILHPTVNSTTGAITNHADTQVSADFGVANSHRGNLGGVISALWSVSSTKIANQLEAIRRAAGIAGVPKPTKIKLNALDKKWLRQNDEFVEWAVAGASNRQREAVDAVLAGDMIKNLWGFDWEFVDGTWLDIDGSTSRDAIPLGRVLIEPEMGSWFRAFQVSEMIPTEVGVVAGDLVTAANKFGTVYGQFAYAKVMDNPGRISQFVGDNFGVGYADPNAVWMPTVFPES